MATPPRARAGVRRARPGRGEPARRVEPARAWYAVSCCPTNVARTLAQLPAYLATADDHGVQLHQYADMEIATSLRGGHDIALRVRTDYPSGGAVTVRITGRRRTFRGPCRCASPRGRRVSRHGWSARTGPAVSWPRA